MFKINQRGIFIFAVLLFSGISPAFGEDTTLQELERIVVTKSNVHLIDPYTADLENQGCPAFSSPVEALNGLPIDLQSRSPKGGIHTDFSLRGSNFQGVLVLIDGKRINDPQTGHFNSDIPLTKEDIERIEVVPGAPSSIFGPDAVGGAINIITKKPKENKGAFELSSGEYQSGNGIFSVTGKKGGLGARVSVEDGQSGGFRQDTDFKKFTSSFASSLEIPDGEFNLDFGYQQKEFGAFDFYTPGLNYPSREWTRTFLLNTGAVLDRGVTIKPDFLWRRHFDKFMLDETGLISKYVNHHRNDEFIPNIYFQKETQNLGTLGLGLEYGEENIISTNLGKHARAHESVFLDDAKELTSKLRLGTSARFDDFEGFGPVYTGSANLRYSVVKNQELHAGINRSMRIPSFTELFYNDPTTVGDP
ncbi:MAG: TonB-dependent receptor, partial [Candidatus Omnitrophica bacterium]|nr:TonB-dependent receptor [Candidatus Omnitrophota bacterium]